MILVRSSRNNNNGIIPQQKCEQSIGSVKLRRKVDDSSPVQKYVLCSQFHCFLMKQQVDSNLSVEENGQNEVFQKETYDPTKLENISTSGTCADESISSEEENGWLGGIGADFRTLAVSLKETAGGVANFVQRSAINVANEIALLEEEEEGAADGVAAEPLHLPWEIKNNQGVYEANDELKLLILEVSKRQSTFLKPYISSGARDDDDNSANSFVLDEPRVEIIRELLSCDTNLSAMHARLSGRSDVRETNFWRNYFHACGETRGDFIENKVLQAESADEKSQNSFNSLVPDSASVEEQEDPNSSKADDDESFVCLSTGNPGSVKSAGMKSIGSVVIVEQQTSNKTSLFDFFG